MCVCVCVRVRVCVSILTGEAIIDVAVRCFFEVLSDVVAAGAGITAIAAASRHVFVGVAFPSSFQVNFHRRR